MKILFTKLLLYILVPSGTNNLNSYNKIEENFTKRKVTNFNPKVEPADFTTENYEKEDRENFQFLMLACNVIKDNYAGDPLGLMSFINSINLLEKIAKNSQIEILRLFIISKLSGSAYDIISDNDNTIENIKASLINSIKYDRYNFVLSRMLLLPYERLSLLQFVKQGELLANDLVRAFKQDGCPHTFAIKETIRKITETCISRTRSESVEIILRAASFENIQDIFAKFQVAEFNERFARKHIQLNKINKFQRFGRQHVHNSFNNSKFNRFLDTKDTFNKTQNPMSNFNNSFNKYQPYVHNTDQNRFSNLNKKCSPSSFVNNKFKNTSTSRKSFIEKSSYPSTYSNQSRHFNEGKNSNFDNTSPNNSSLTHHHSNDNVRINNSQNTNCKENSLIKISKEPRSGFARNNFNSFSRQVNNPYINRTPERGEKFNCLIDKSPNVYAKSSSVLPKFSYRHYHHEINHIQRPDRPDANIVTIEDLKE